MPGLCNLKLQQFSFLHIQCMNNHYAKFKYLGMKIIGVTDYTNQTPSKHFSKKNIQSSRPKKSKRKIVKCVQNKWCTSSMCANHKANFEYKRIKTVGVTDYTSQTPSTHFGWKKCLSSTPIKNEKIFIKCAQNGRCTSSMCEKS